jgi:hypothetical protein
MSTLTPELNLAQGVDGDDTADYLTIGLAQSLAIVDGMFHATTGHAHNGAHQGGTLGPNAFADNTLPGAKLVDGSVTAAKLTPGALTPEAFFTGATVSTAVHYTVVSPVMFVFCSVSVTVTLPAAASTNRPITIQPGFGITVTVISTGGTVYGGSFNLTTGAVMNGTIVSSATTMEAVTYKSNGTNWHAV